MRRLLPLWCSFGPSLYASWFHLELIELESSTLPWHGSWWDTCGCKEDPWKCCKMVDTEIWTSFRKFEGVTELFFDETHKNKVKKRGNLKKSGQKLQNQPKSVSSLWQDFLGSYVRRKVTAFRCISMTTESNERYPWATQTADSGMCSASHKICQTVNYSLIGGLPGPVNFTSHPWSSSRGKFGKNPGRPQAYPEEIWGNLGKCLSQILLNIRI